MKSKTITDLKVIESCPQGKNLLTVKIETDDPSVYGLGCGTFHQRHFAVKSAIETYLKPILIGKDPSHIEDLWNMLAVSSYWRGGPVLNNALSGVDMALWDIKGKLADMPLYQLFGGKSRAAVPVYVHAKGNSHDEVFSNIRRFMDQGYRHIRCQIGEYGGVGQEIRSPEGIPKGVYFDPEMYMEDTISLFREIRKTFGNSFRILHDVHERLYPSDAIRFAKAMEEFELYYLEDIFAPENQEWLKELRNHSSVPIAMGELYSHPCEWKNMIGEHLIDFIRLHLSDIGGITPARKVAVFSEIHSVRTAWHGPPDLTPIGMAANIHLDISAPNTGIQEYCAINEVMRDIYPGAPEPVNGYFYPIDRPGLGVDINEELAREYPCKAEIQEWTNARLPDGTSVKP